MATTATGSTDLDTHLRPKRGKPERIVDMAHGTGHDDFAAPAPSAELRTKKLHSVVFEERQETATETRVPEVDTHILLIDLENAQPTDLGTQEGKDTRIYLFLSQTQTRLPLGLVQALQPLGSAVNFVHGKPVGRNSMNTVISFFLGRLSMELPQARFTVVSKDTSFDTLVSHMKEAGVQCRRIADNQMTDTPARGALSGIARTEQQA